MSNHINIEEVLSRLKNDWDIDITFEKLIEYGEGETGQFVLENGNLYVDRLGNFSEVSIFNGKSIFQMSRFLNDEGDEWNGFYRGKNKDGKFVDYFWR